MIKKRNHKVTIVFVAGETSGDILGAGLIRAIKILAPNSRFFGIAGPLMKAEGCEVWYKMEELEVMGVIEIFSRLHRLLRIRADLIRRCCEVQPDVFVGIDAPDFNLTLEENLKKRGIKTVHYVSPSVWIWRRNRVFKVGKSANLVLTLFPFEEEFYKKFNIPCCFVGHAAADAFSLYPDKNAARDILRISYNARSLVILPGSRKTEIEMLSADFLNAAKILRKIYPDLEIIVPLVNVEHRMQFERIKSNVASNLEIKLLDGKSHEAMIASDVALVASGTATLECMFAKCPMVVCYRMKPITFWLAKRLVRTKYISLPNLLSGREIVREFIQEKCQPKDLAKVLLKIILKKKENQKTIEIFREIHKKIRCNANVKAANAILDLAKN